MSDPWRQPPTPRPRRRGWDAIWRVALIVLAALAVGFLIDRLLGG